jgi:hypothetical protein
MHDEIREELIGSTVAVLDMDPDDYFRGFFVQNTKNGKKYRIFIDDVHDMIAAVYVTPFYGSGKELKYETIIGTQIDAIRFDPEQYFIREFVLTKGGKRYSLYISDVHDRIAGVADDMRCAGVAGLVSGRNRPILPF